MSAYLNALAEEGTREDLLAQIARLTEDRAHTAAAHSARVAELLEANNREVEKRRIAERALDASSFQRRVGHWMQACFGPAISADKLERGDRLLEEVLELLQSGGYPPERVAALTGYVWSRPAGEPAQEVGGVEVTLAAYCLAHGLDKHQAGETELARIWTKVEAIRAKQAAKPTGSALPQAWANPASFARVAIPEMKSYPVEPGALRASIAELDTWLDSSDALDEIENQQSFGESIMLVVHELKRLQALSPAPAAGEAFRPTHWHIKRGSEYRVIGEAEAQVSTGDYRPDWTVERRIADGDRLTVYQGTDGKMWVRFTDEFNDGRFVALEAEA
ncbi:hypothetical protein [Xanthobacter sp.]|uniref:hypothetical protein n=1 Tax=Xanthobacter sp. TaxID=35809 RepID=UPI0025D3ABBD|nr:hypothetical protein [Xanthobacter sp.]